MADVGAVGEPQGVENSVEIETLAKFAVDEHNKKEVLFSYYFSLFPIVCSQIMGLVNGPWCEIQIRSLVWSGLHTRLNRATPDADENQILFPFIYF